MRRLSVVFALALALTAIAAVPVSGAVPGGLQVSDVSEAADGFILLDTNASYAAFNAPDDCTVFVGYVRTDRLKFIGQPGGFHPHSDLEVRVQGPCLDPGYSLVGVTDTLTDPDAVFDTLASASIAGIDVDLYLTDESTGDMSLWGDAEADLDWVAEGEVVEWKVNNPADHSNHESRSAPVSGTVTITETGETAPWFVVDDDDVIDEDWFTNTGELPGPIITFYDEATAKP